MEKLGNITTDAHLEPGRGLAFMSDKVKGALIFIQIIFKLGIEITTHK